MLRYARIKARGSWHAPNCSPDRHVLSAERDKLPTVKCMNTGCPRSHAVRSCTWHMEAPPVHGDTRARPPLSTVSDAKIGRPSLHAARAQYRAVACCRNARGQRRERGARAGLEPRTPALSHAKCITPSEQLPPFVHFHAAPPAPTNIRSHPGSQLAEFKFQ